MKKTFVLDTNIMLFDPQCIFKFQENIVHIPLICIEELDRFKKDPNENGRNARHFSRLIDQLRKKGSLVEGVDLDHGGKLIISDNRDIPEISNFNFTLEKNDNFILGTALKLKKKTKTVVLITKDINLRIKADILGIPAEDYEPSDSTFDDFYSGHTTFETTSARLEEYLKRGFFALSADETLNLNPNQYVTLYDPSDKGLKMYGRYSLQQGGITGLIPTKEGVWGIYPKNLEQQFAFDALLNDEVKLVSLVGKAGTGKTLLAIAAALEKTLSQNQYIRILVSRPIQPMGKDLGFLPGDIREKIAPWMLPIYDALDFLFGKMKTGHQGSMGWGSLEEKGLLQVEALTYIRGRSIPSQFFIIDEAQNLSPHEVKTIITRVGEGSKIILAGDCDQIDNPYLDSVNNGLVYAVERLKKQPNVSHITLKSGERSELSEIASQLL